jgi:hypothetical protein
MEELLARKQEIEQHLKGIDAEEIKLCRELELVSNAIRELEIGKLTEDYTNFLEKRLTILKKYIEAARDALWINYRLGYVIKKLKMPRENDYHEPEPDYLPWTIYDNECLAMVYSIDIIIEIYSSAVEQFVVDWITKNIPDMKKDSLFRSYD